MTGASRIVNFATANSALAPKTYCRPQIRYAFQLLTAALSLTASGFMLSLYAGHVVILSSRATLSKLEQLLKGSLESGRKT